MNGGVHLLVEQALVVVHPTEDAGRRAGAYATQVVQGVFTYLRICARLAVSLADALPVHNDAGNARGDSRTDGGGIRREEVQIEIAAHRMRFRAAIASVDPYGHPIHEPARTSSRLTSSKMRLRSPGGCSSRVATAGRRRASPRLNTTNGKSTN